MCTADDMSERLAKVLHGGGKIQERTRIQCIVKSTFSETKLVPGMNDMLISNPSPAAVSRFRMGFIEPIDISDRAHLKDGGSSVDERETLSYKKYGTVTRFNNVAYDIRDSINIWSSGMWISTATGSTAAIKAAGGQPMDLDSSDLQYLIREHIHEHGTEVSPEIDNGFVRNNEQLHLRWNSQSGTIFIDGSHLTHDLHLGDEILINSNAPPLQLFVNDE